MAARERVVRSIHDLAGRLEQRAALVRTAGIRNAIRTTPRDDAPAARADGVQVGIEMFTVFRGVLHVAGWAYDPQGPVRAVGVATGGNRPQVVAVPGLPSPDLIGRFGPAAAAVRFAGSLPCRDPAAALSGVVCFLTEQGWARRPDAPQHALAADAYGELWRTFLQELRTRPPGRIVEVGGRDRAGWVLSEHLPADWDYCSFDIVDGPHVDVVGDAHDLSKSFEAGSVDAVVSVATFEHLAMPWQVVLEIGKVLRPGGLCCVVTHQTWPVHEEPWDFWRFSQFTWPVLFNAATGFEVLAATMGQPGRVVPAIMNRVTADMPDATGYLGTAVLARKVAEPRVCWDVSMAEVVRDVYPR